MEPLIVFISFSLSVFGAYLIVRFPAVFLISGDKHVTAKQSSWRHKTPRTGGLALILAVSVATYISANETGLIILASALPLLCAGLIEDTTSHEVSPKYRLLIAMLCAGIACSWFGITIDRIDIVWLDPILQVSFVSFMFTIFAIAGFTHALNLVDGLNGLSSFIAITIMSAFGYLAYSYGHNDLFALNVFVAVAFLGFMLFNFPNGRIFLGDAGAYCFGFVIALNAVLLLNREPDIAAWAILIILFWPVADTLWAMLRRVLTSMPIGKPDRLHFHSVLQRSVMIKSRNKIELERANPIASLLLWPAVIIPVLLGVFLVEEKQIALFAAIGMSGVFVASYHGVVYFSTRIPRSRNK